MAHETNTTPAASTASFRQRALFGTIAILILLGAGVYAYMQYSNREVDISSSTISAPLISLSANDSGRLDAVYVQAGDTVPANTPVALVGTDVVKTKVAGLIVDVTNTIGAQVPAGQPVVKMIDPSQLRVVGKIDENKGLSQIQVGDPVNFTVDAFSGQTFHGIVDEVAPTSNQSGIVFNISNQRQTQQFDVKARFDVNAYPQLKNGMSARMYVFTH